MTLVVTGLLKLIESSAGHEWLRDPDPLLVFLENGQLLMVAGALEIGVATYMQCSKDLLRRSLALGWIVGIFIAYKIGQSFMWSNEACGCFGILGTALKLSARQLEFLSWIVICGLGMAAVWIGVGWRLMQRSSRL